MHILLIHQAFAAIDQPGGTRHHEFARYFAAQGHKVTILTGQVHYLTGETLGRGWVERKSDDRGVEIWRCYTLKSYHRSFLWRILGFLSFSISSFLIGLSVREVDIVWGTSPPIFQALSAWVLARFKRTRYVVEIRDLWPHFAVAAGVLHNRALIRMAEIFERLLYRRSDRVVVNSPGYVDHVRAGGAMTVEIVPNGVDPRMYPENTDGSALRHELGFDKDFVVLYAGAHGLSNDLGIVLDAAEQLREDLEIRFVLVGDGKEKVSLQEEARGRALTNVSFQPPVPKEAMAATLAAADACLAILLPIEAYKTTYPNKVFDYMAASRPVLLAIDGVIRDVIEQAQGGVYVPPGDAEALAAAVWSLANDRFRARQMGAAGRSYVLKHFERSTLAQRMLDVMLSMTGEENNLKAAPVEKENQA